MRKLFDKMLQYLKIPLLIVLVAALPACGAESSNLTEPDSGAKCKLRRFLCELRH